MSDTKAKNNIVIGRMRWITDGRNGTADLSHTLVRTSTELVQKNASRKAGKRVESTRGSRKAESMQPIFDLLTELWNSGNLELLAQVYGDDTKRSDPNTPQPVHGTQPIADYIAEVRTGFPDFKIEIKQQVGEGDQVVSEWTCTGTHKGVYQGIPAAGRYVTVPGVSVNRIQDGKIVEEHAYFDRLGLLQQLGVVPGQSAATAAA